MLTLRANGVLTCEATQNAGPIVLRIAPVGEQPVDVDTRIAAGTHENHAAQVLTDSLKASPGQSYHAEKAAREMYSSSSAATHLNSR
jgi:hypothetical protein